MQSFIGWDTCTVFPNNRGPKGSLHASASADCMHLHSQGLRGHALGLRCSSAVGFVVGPLGGPPAYPRDALIEVRSGHLKGPCKAPKTLIGRLEAL